MRERGVGGEGERRRFTGCDKLKLLSPDFFFLLLLSKCKYHENRKGDSSMIAYFSYIYLCVAVIST